MMAFLPLLLIGKLEVIFKELIEEIIKEFSSLSLKRKPKLLWRVISNPIESISIEYSGGVVRVEANSERNLIFALAQSITAIKSEYLGEYLGKCTPRFSFRPLWVLDTPTEAFCKSLCCLGYNAVIVTDKVDLSLFKAYGLKVFVKPEHIGKLDIKGIDGVFWESELLDPEFRDHPDGFDLTLFDRVNNELGLIEKSIGDLELIYYVPFSEEVYWLPGLMDNAGPRTSIAFSAVAGDPVDDYLPRHPFWETLRGMPDISATPLLPILNTGAVGQGECLWPALPIDLLDQFLPRLVRHNFSGFIGMTTNVPKNLGLLHLSLWTAGQALWYGKVPELSVETWLKAHRPDFEFSFEDFIVMRDIVKGVRQMQAKERQGSLLAALNFLELKHKRSDYFPYFAADMRNLLQSSDSKDSFWTKSQMGKVIRLERPQNKTPLMNKIILENT